MEELGVSKTALIGFSIGGMINRRFAMDFPDSLTSLAILNSPHDRGEEAQAAVEARAKMVREEGGLSTLPAALERWFTAQYRQADSKGLELVRNWREQVDPESYAQAAWVLANGVRELILRLRFVHVTTSVDVITFVVFKHTRRSGETRTCRWNVLDCDRWL